MQRLKFADASFLYAETANARMNIASVQLLDLPARNRDAWFTTLRAYLAANLHKIGFMTRRLVDTPFGLDHPIWVTDSRFALDNHLKRARLPSPGSPRQLEQLVARLHERPLDRSRPLWEFHLIEGLEDGRVAWYTKYHHACIDGMAGQQIIDLLFTDSPAGKPAPSAQPLAASSERAPAFVTQMLDALLNAASEPLRNLLRMSDTFNLQTRLSALLGDPASAGAYGLQPPHTRFNTTVSAYRNVAFGSLPLGQVRALGKARKASVNDVFLNVCAGGIRRYLQRHGELPATPLTAGVPVSTRAPGDTGMDNRVSMLLASLATDIDDPLARLDAISASTRIGKRVVAEMAALPSADPHVPGLPQMAASAAQFAENLHLADTSTPTSNVVISNVPGPRTVKYLCGAAMTTHYPVSIASNGAALNITVQSYVDRMDFSLTACLEAVPDAHLLRDDLLRAWQELRAAVESDAVLQSAA